MRKKALKNLDRLFELLQAGQTPDFLQMMSALSDVSTMFPDRDSASQATAGSQKSDKGIVKYPFFQPRCSGCE